MPNRHTYFIKLTNQHDLSKNSDLIILLLLSVTTVNNEWTLHECDVIL